MDADVLTPDVDVRYFAISLIYAITQMPRMRANARPAPLMEGSVK